MHILSAFSDLLVFLLVELLWLEVKKVKMVGKKYMLPVLEDVVCNVDEHDCVDDK